MLPAHHLWIYSMSYVLFFCLLLLSKAKKGIRLLDDNGIVENRVMLILLHVGGVLLFGVLSFCAFNTSLHVIVFGQMAPDALQIVIIFLFAAFIFIIAPTLAEKNRQRLNNFLAGANTLSNRFVTNYFFIRILFLAAYEIWFRGYLLTECIGVWGVPVAILINIVLYSLLHIVNGKKEMLACIPFGSLLCILCIWTKAAWPAILMHIALTFSYEIHLVKRINKPSISFV